MYHNDDLIYEKSMKNADITNMINKIKKRYHPSAMFVTTDEYPNVIYRSSGLSRISVFFYRMWYFFQLKYREPSVISNDLFKEQLSKGDINVITFENIPLYSFEVRPNVVISTCMIDFLGDMYPLNISCRCNNFK